MKKFVEIIPLLSLPKSLGYFDYAIPDHLLETIEVGQIVDVPWRKKTTKAIITKIKKETTIKQLKEIVGVVNGFSPLSESFLALINWFSNYHNISLALAAKTILPTIKKTKKLAANLSLPPTHQFPFTASKISLKNQINFWQTNEELINRHLQIINLAQTLIEQNKQVLILVPQALSLEQLAPLYQETFGDKLSIISSNTAAGQHTALWQKFAQGEIKIVLGSRLAIFLPFEHAGLIILDQSNNESYQQWDLNPRYHTKKVATKITELNTNLKLLFVDKLPNLSEYQASLNNQLFIQTDDSQKLPAKPQLIDLKQELAGRNFSLFSQELHVKLTQALNNKERAILFINQRGLASSLICRDCGWLATCKQCHQPLIWHQVVAEQPDLWCHYCQKRELSPPLCPKCHGANLKFQGLGTQKVEQELKKIFPSAKILRLDSDKAKDQNGQISNWEKWRSGEYDFLVGTQMILNLPLTAVETVAIINDSAMLNQADFNATEKMYLLLSQLNSLAKKNLIIQTYNTETAVLGFFVHDEWKKFYDQELLLRQEYHYPPFSQYVKLLSIPANQLTGNEVNQLFATLNKNNQLTVYPPQKIFDHFWRWQIIIKKPHQTDWGVNIPDEWLMDVDE